uniref:Small ribosomal subunit protein mS26 n=1 Tax=Meloidogyne incognita TaxID=6306 RepID=A0A914M3J2_MELIC
MQIPTKMELYEVKQAEWTAPEDVADLFWRRIVYNSAILSMRRIFREEYEASPTGFNAIQIKKEANEELDRLIEENEKRNKDLADARVKREKEVIERLEEETLLEIERRLDRETEKAAIKTEQILSLIVSLFFINFRRQKLKLTFFLLIFEIRFKHFFYTYPGVYKKFQFTIFHKLLILFKEQSKNLITKENLDEKSSRSIGKSN